MIRAALAALSALLMAAAPATVAAQKKPLHVLATTTTLAALVEPVAGPDATVSSLLPIGASPETYQPSPADIVKVHDADVLVENGAGLEVWLNQTVQNAKNPALRILVCTDGLPVRNLNPHLWMDPVFAERYVAKIADVLSQAEPADAAAFHRRAAAYEAQLAALARRTQGKIDTLPPAQRTMIVYHNAWEYYDARFGLKTVGVIETSPGQEPSPHALGDLVRLARRYHVRAVFAEPEYNPRLAQALARSAGITTVVDLYDDSIGTDPRVATYVGMIDYDTDVIVRALR